MAHKQSNDEQRMFPRISKKITVEVSKLSTEEPGETGISKNISSGGICLVVPIPYDPETWVCLKFSIPGHQDHGNPFTLVLGVSALSTIGEVARCQKLSDDLGYEVGIKFMPRNFGEAKKLLKLASYFMAHS